MSIQHLLFEGQNEKVPPLSLAAAAHNLLFVSGIPGYDAEFRLSERFSEQLQQAFGRLRETLARGGVTPREVIKTGVFLTRAADLPELNRQYAQFFGSAPYPARTTCIVAALPDPLMLVEIDCVADVATRTVVG